MITPFIKFILDPFTLLGILLFILITAIFLKKDRLSRWSAIAAGLWFIIISTPLIPTLVIHSLERRYVPVDVATLPNKNAPYHIIILGGGHGFDDRLPANSLLSKRALGRLNEGIRLHRQLPNSKLVLSGFSASGRTTQAEMLQQTAFLLGIDPPRTILQEEPSNTYEEAHVYASTYGQSHPVIIVTSAFHMPRARKVFRSAGVDATASPANYRLKGSWRYRWLGLPALSNVENMGIGISEYAALAWYDLKY